MSHIFSFLALVLSSAAVAAQNPISGLTPSFSSCPSGFNLTRLPGGTPASQTLSPDEASYISTRNSTILPTAWKAYLANVEGTDIALPDYVAQILQGNASSQPTLGIATSGGGYRAAIFGAGMLNALDGRNASSASAGTGGLLQASTYLSGLSGGSWLVTSLAQADFPTIQQLIFGPGSNDTTEYAGWLAQFDLLTPSDDPAVDLAYLGELLAEVKPKHDAGFHVSVVDLYSRALSRHFLNGTSGTDFFSLKSTHGARITFSGIANVSSFISHNMPFPIIVADMVSDNENTTTIIAGDEVPLTNPLIEFSPFEMGSYDPALSAFTPTKFLGTQNTTVCVTGFDQAMFLSGSSSDIFNGFNTSLSALVNSTVGPLLTALNATFPQTGVQLVTALYPNPFRGVANQTFLDSNQHILNLVDGGEDGEVVPIQPLLVKARGVDVIFAIDATSDTDDNFSDGSSLIAAQDRVNLISAYDFPPVPTNTSDFVSQNLTTRPTFFGCDTDISAPLIIYLANGGPPANGEGAITNTSTLQIKYEPSEIQAMLDQVHVVATQGISANETESSDPVWPACLACAIVDRARNRTGVARSGVCESCFGRYCWNDSLATAAGPNTSTSGSSASNGATSVMVGANGVLYLLGATAVLGLLTTIM